jgi:hypothetical protein
MQTLNQILEAGLKFGGLGLYKDQVPNFIYSNLKDGFGQRPYQQKAFGRFVFNGTSITIDQKEFLFTCFIIWQLVAVKRL